MNGNGNIDGQQLSTGGTFNCVHAQGSLYHLFIQSVRKPVSLLLLMLTSTYSCTMVWSLYAYKWLLVTFTYILCLDAALMYLPGRQIKCCMPRVHPCMLARYRKSSSSGSRRKWMRSTSPTWTTCLRVECSLRMKWSSMWLSITRWVGRCKLCRGGSGGGVKIHIFAPSCHVLSGDFVMSGCHQTKYHADSHANSYGYRDYLEIGNSDNVTVK